MRTILTTTLSLILLLALASLPTSLTVPETFADSDSGSDSDSGDSDSGDSDSDSDSDSDRVDICHVTGSGSIKAKRVSPNAVPAHLNHGDFLPLAFYADADGDGFGDAASSVEACEAPAGFVGDDTDCDDGDAAVNPGAEEIPGDGVDNDCNPDTPDVVVTCPCNQPGSGWAFLVAGGDFEDVENPSNLQFDEAACVEDFLYGQVIILSGILGFKDGRYSVPIVAQYDHAPVCISLGFGALVTAEEKVVCEQEWRAIAALNGLTCGPYSP